MACHGRVPFLERTDQVSDVKVGMRGVGVTRGVLNPAHITRRITPIPNNQLGVHSHSMSKLPGLHLLDSNNNHSPTQLPPSMLPLAMVMDLL